MKRALCERCGAKQPKDWAPGHLCGECGAAVREEVRCVWCVQWVPEARFCRSCGCEIVEEARFGAGRMLKAGGVDRFSIPRMFRELDGSQVEDLTRRYERQLAAVERRIDEARFCEGHLLLRTYSIRLEDELIPLLPLEEDRLAALAGGPRGPFAGGPELLLEIARESPVALTRAIASIALLRQGKIHGMALPMAAATIGVDQEVSLEAALAAGHWRNRLSCSEILGGRGIGIGPDRVMELAKAVPERSPLRPWAAAAAAMVEYYFQRGTIPPPADPAEEDRDEVESLRVALRDGLASSDPDLRFTCALSLGEEEIVAGALRDDDGEKRSVARRYLAARGSPALARTLLEGSLDVRSEILEHLPTPPPDPLLEGVLRAVEEGDAETRAKGIYLLRPVLTEAIVERLVRVALREKDGEVPRILLGAEVLPEGKRVVGAIIELGLFDALHGALYDAAWHVDFSDGALEKLAERGGPGALDSLLAIASRKLDSSRGSSGEAAGAGETFSQELLATMRFLAQLVFGPFPAEARCRALDLLFYHGPSGWNWLSPESVKDLFGSPAGLLRKVTKLLGDKGSHQVASKILDMLVERWDGLCPHIGRDRTAIRGFLDALIPASREETALRPGASRIVARMAALHPAEALPAAAVILREAESIPDRSDLLTFVLEAWPEMSRFLRKDDAALGTFAEALLDLLQDRYLSDHVQNPLCRLLERIAADHPKLRDRIAVVVERLLADLGDFPSDEKERLETLAGAMGLPKERPTRSVPSTDTPEPPPLNRDALDHEVVLPGTKMPTLADYAKFSRELAASGDPMEVLARLGISMEEYLGCVESWGQVLSTRNDLAIRYGELLGG